MAGGRKNIEHREAGAARQRERRHRIREHPDQKIGEADSRIAVETAAAGEAREKARRADFFLFDIKQHPSQFPCIAQSEIEPLPGNWVERLRGVADRENSGRGVDGAAAQRQRKGRSRARRTELPEPSAESLTQARQKLAVGKAAQLLGRPDREFLARLKLAVGKAAQLLGRRRTRAPYQGVAISEGEQRERPLESEALPRSAARRP